MGAEDSKKSAGGVLGLFVGLVIVAGLLYGVVYVNIMSQDNPMVMAVTGFIFLLIVGSSVFKTLNIDMGALTVETILIIVLTLVFIQVSYPFFSPRVEVISSEMVSGYSNDDGTFVVEIITATVKKPMVMFFGDTFPEYCTDISFFLNVETIVDSPGAELVRVGNSSKVCTSGSFDIVTRVLQFAAEVKSNVDYLVADTGLEYVGKTNNTSEQIIYSVDAANKMSFPLILKGKVVDIKIGENTLIPSLDRKTGDTTMKLFYDEIITNFAKNQCEYDLRKLISSSIKFQEGGEEFENTFKGNIEDVILNNDVKTIILKTRLYGTLEPGRTTEIFIEYTPVWCFKPPLKEVVLVQTSIEDADVIIPSG